MKKENFAEFIEESLCDVLIECNKKEADLIQFFFIDFKNHHQLFMLSLRDMFLEGFQL